MKKKPVKSEYHFIASFEECFISLCDEYGINNYHLAYSERVDNNNSHWQSLYSEPTVGMLEVLEETPELLKEKHDF